jgi:hypothetical protein
LEKGGGVGDVYGVGARVIIPKSPSVASCPLTSIASSGGTVTARDHELTDDDDDKSVSNTFGNSSIASSYYGLKIDEEGDSIVA